MLEPITTAAELKAARKPLGTLKHVAAELGIHWVTLGKYEAGMLPLPRPVALAIECLARRGAEKTAASDCDGR